MINMHIATAIVSGAAKLKLRRHMPRAPISLFTLRNVLIYSVNICGRQADVSHNLRDSYTSLTIGCTEYNTNVLKRNTRKYK